MQRVDSVLSVTFWVLTTSEGREWMDRPPKNISKKMFFRKNVGKNKFFLEAVNQLKKTSDCIKNDPPGPGQNLEKSQKSWKNDP